MGKVSGCKACQAQGLSFALMPRMLKVKKGRAEIILAAIPSSPVLLPDAELLASIKNRKTKFVYNKKLKKLLKELNWTAKEMKPLEAYMAKQLKQGAKNPETMLTLIQEQLQNTPSPTFSVEITAQNPLYVGPPDDPRIAST